MNKWVKKASVTMTLSASLLIGVTGGAFAKTPHPNGLAKHPLHIKGGDNHKHHVPGFAKDPIKIKHKKSNSGVNSPITNDATPTYQGGYTPAQMRHAYGVDNLTQTGAGQTIAIVDAYGSPSIAQDLQQFDQKFGLPSANLQVVYPQGQPAADGGWAIETSLDVEWAHVMAPGAKIMVVAAKSSSLSDLLNAEQYATNHGATVVSNSWGGSEFSSESNYNSYFTHAGIVYLASSGDNGAGASWPATSPNVVAVGGTSLNIDNNGNYMSESAWSGSGGGLSSYFSRPSFLNNWTSVVGSKRGFPDVSFDANPNTGVAVYDSTPDQGQQGWFVVGGTSLGAPSVAGIVALINQSRGSNFSSSGLLNALYNTAGTTGSVGYKTNFHDVTTGNDGSYYSRSGYDLVTGLGSPIANKLVPSLANY